MFEDFVKPLMDDQGYINGAELKQYIDIVTYTGQVRQNGELTAYPDSSGFEALSKLRKVQYYMMDK